MVRASEAGVFPPLPEGFHGDFRTDLPARHVYADAAGIVRIIPAAVAAPADIGSVERIVAWSREAGLAITPRGSGSSMAGGSVGEGLLLDLSRLDSVGAVDAVGRRLRCGPGATCAAVDAAARAQGLHFPIDPSSAAFCTVGGMVGTNAAGARAPRHGQMRDWVLSLDCVLADGSRITLTRGTPPPSTPLLDGVMGTLLPWIEKAEERAPAVHAGVMKEASGYATNRFATSHDLVDLIVGSEGTLAIVVGVELALVPLPAATASVLGAFATLESAIAAAAAARVRGASACELLDRTYLDVARAESPAIPLAEALLIAEVAGADGATAGTAAASIEVLFTDAGATMVCRASGVEEERELWRVRHAVSPAIARMSPELKSMQIVEDAAVPLSAVADFVRGVREVAAASGTPVVIFGHAADGNVHVNPLIDTSRPDWRAVVERFGEELSALAGKLGGTVSGEHGDGRLRLRWMERCWPGEVLERFRRVKEAFDPDFLLNPGVKVPAPNNPAWSNRYDPAGPELHESAVRGLAEIERERRYDRFRLALL